jgi:hypothetical protein
MLAKINHLKERSLSMLSQHFSLFLYYTSNSICPMNVGYINWGKWEGNDRKKEGEREGAKGENGREQREKEGSWLCGTKACFYHCFLSPDLYLLTTKLVNSPR